MPTWADKVRHLAKEAGSTGGKWLTSTVEVARGAMLAVTEQGVHTITVMCCTQLMKTALLESIVGYFAHLDPSPMLMLQPKEEAAEQFSKERITPMIRVTPKLRKVFGPGGRKGKENILYKPFPGGFLALAGAGAADNVARRPIRVVLADEIDKYVFTREGNTIILAEERTATFANWLSVRSCSPTIDGESLIQASYEEGDQRKASVVCPHCGHRQFLDFFKHVEWSKDGHGQHLTDTARIYCECCGTGWSEGERLEALNTIRWHQTKGFWCCGNFHSPLDDYAKAVEADDATSVDAVWGWDESPRHAVYRAKCPTCGKHGVSNAHASFQAGKLYSPWAKDSPKHIAAKWIAAQGNEDNKLTFYNTQLGLPYRLHGGKELKVDLLASRGEVWPASIPDGVASVTVGVDVQDYRVEMETVGWGKNEESWSIDYNVIEGEFDDPIVQAKLDEYLKTIRHRADGRPYEVMAACIDSGGHHTNAVYEFCKARIGRRVWAIKGESATGGQRNPVWPTKRPSNRNKKSYRPVILGVNSAKDTIRSRLYLESPGPGYMHFPADRDLGWFHQLTAERIVIKEVGGKRYRVWDLPSGKANEAGDCRVYAYGALCGLMHFGLQLNKVAERCAEQYQKPEGQIEIEQVSPVESSNSTSQTTTRPERKFSLSRLA